MEHEESPRYVILMCGVVFVLFLLAARICTLELAGY